MFKIWCFLVCLSLAAVSDQRKLHFKDVYSESKHFLNYETNSDVLKLVVMGDWGGLPFYPYYSPFEYATSKHLMNVAVGGNYHAVLALGDNFYFNGVTDEYDSRFQNTFENVFNNQAFETIPWFVLGGNHDHYGNITGQLEYTKHSSRWHYPALWYKLQLSGIGFNITVVMIDTVTLCGNTVYDGAQPKGTEDHIAAESQLSFIEDSLKQTTDSYVIVAGHFPVWSVAEHGPTECLLQKLKPLLEKYKATAYMCGHDHNLQHIREANSTVDYFVSGAVDVVTPSMKHKDAVPENSLQFYWGNLLGLGGFATVDATKDEMVLKYHSATGSVLYSYAMKPRK